MMTDRSTPGDLEETPPCWIILHGYQNGPAILYLYSKSQQMNSVNHQHAQWNGMDHYHICHFTFFGGKS